MSVLAVDLARRVLRRADRTVSTGLNVVVGYVLSRLDVTALVRDNVDLDRLASEVINDVDLQQMIRDSSVAVSSETVRGLRAQSIEADQAVSRIVDRVLFRQRGRPNSNSNSDGSGELDKA